ncbi:MAG TPA: XrtA system polysaccharide chain length determinant [Povalibacter sp.]
MKEQVEFILEHLRGIWRFRWIGMGVTWAVCLAGWLVTLMVPDSYEASARVFVDTETALSEATRGMTVDTSVETQIQRVRQALLGGPQLTKVADETQLTARAVTPQDRQAVVEGLRDQIEIEGGISRDSPGAGVFLISYRNPDRDTSLKVVDRLVNTFVESTLGGKREGSEQAQKFLVEQIAEYEDKLRQAEERLAAFKKENVGLMPGAQGDYFTRLQAEADQLSKAQTNLAVATRRRDELQRQLRGEQPLISSSQDGSGSVPSAPAGAGGDTASRIRESQQRLDELLLRFTEKHPDVIALRAALKDLEQRQATEIAAARRGDTGAAARIGLSASPVFQNLQLQYNQVEVEIAALRADIGDRQQRITSLRSLINTAPEVEAEFSRLDRDYGVTKTQYQALVERLGRARLGEQAAQTGVIRFEVIDPPNAGFKPTAPKRPLLAAGVLFAAIAAGVGVAFVMNWLRPVFGGARQLNEITGRPVLGMVSMTWIERYEVQERRNTIAFAAAAMALIVLSGIFILVQQALVRSIQGWMA